MRKILLGLTIIIGLISPAAGEVDYPTTRNRLGDRYLLDRAAAHCMAPAGPDQPGLCVSISRMVDGFGITLANEIAILNLGSQPIHIRDIKIEDQKGNTVTKTYNYAFLKDDARVVKFSQNRETDAIRDAIVKMTITTTERTLEYNLPRVETLRERGAKEKALQEARREELEANRVATLKASGLPECTSEAVIAVFKQDPGIIEIVDVSEVKNGETYGGGNTVDDIRRLCTARIFANSGKHKIAFTIEWMKKSEGNGD
jgi:hypothetical protein